MMRIQRRTGHNGDFSRNETVMDGEANRLLASLLTAGTPSELKPHLRIVELTQGEVLAEPLEPIRRVYFPTQASFRSWFP